jgi:hypothetical protein
MITKVEEMKSIPAKSWPFHYDFDRQGIRINDRFMAMFVSYMENELVIVDMLTGKRIKMTFPPAEEVQPTKPEKTASREHTDTSRCVDIKA